MQSLPGREILQMLKQVLSVVMTMLIAIVGNRHDAIKGYAPFQMHCECCSRTPEAFLLANILLAFQLKDLLTQYMPILLAR